MVPIEYYVGLSAILFSIGAMGVLIRRNPIVIFMSVEYILSQFQTPVLPAGTNL